MMYVILLAILVSPLVTTWTMAWLTSSGRLERYSDQEISALRGAHYPRYYKHLTVALVAAGLGVPILMAVWFTKQTYDTRMVSGLLMSMFAHDAVFSNPSPSIFIVGVALFIVVFFGGLLASTALFLLLPPRLLTYMSARTRGSLVVTPRSSAQTLRKIVDGVFVVTLVMALVSLPLYTYVGPAGINHLSTYPFHETTSFSDVQQLNVECRVTHSPGHPEEVAIRVSALSHGTPVTVFSTSDGRLPIRFTSTSEIAAMYALFAEHHVPVYTHADPACAQGAASLPGLEARRQYQALFAP